MIYDANPPYEILQNRLIDFGAMHRLRRFARYWDMVGNSGNFVETTPLIWSSDPGSQTGQLAAAKRASGSPFHQFLRWSEWLHGKTRRTDSIALARLMQLLFEFLTQERGLDAKTVACSLWNDYRRGGRRDKPVFLKDLLDEENHGTQPGEPIPNLPKRQARHTRPVRPSRARLAQEPNKANMGP
jgi:hypothetical protein